jgi:hypothetical protein
MACGHPGGFGKTAEPFGLFANLRMGMTLDQVRKLAPESKQDPKDANVWTAMSEDGTRYEADFVDGHVEKVVIEPPTKVTRADLEKAWGTPRRADAAYVIIYINADKTLRAETPTGDSVELTYYPIVPAEKLLGRDTFDGVKLLGRPVADVKKEFSNRPHVRNEEWIANDYSAQINNIFSATDLWKDTTLDIRSGDDAVVSSWTLTGSFDVDASGKAALDAMFEKLWGKSTKNGDRDVYGTDPVITVDRTDGNITYVRVETKQQHDLNREPPH